jgi:hypothetical protein
LPKEEKFTFIPMTESSLEKVQFQILFSFSDPNIYIFYMERPQTFIQNEKVQQNYERPLQKDHQVNLVDTASIVFQNLNHIQNYDTPLKRSGGYPLANTEKGTPLKSDIKPPMKP